MHNAFSDICSDAAVVKPQEEEEETEDKSFSENGMDCVEGVTDPRTYTHTHPHTHTYTSHTLDIFDIFPLRFAVKLTPSITNYFFVHGHYKQLEKV